MVRFEQEDNRSNSNDVRIFLKKFLFLASKISFLALFLKQGDEIVGSNCDYGGGFDRTQR